MPSRRPILRLLLMIACLTALAWAVHRLGPRRVLQVAAGADPRWLLASFLPVLGRFALWGVKWQRILARKGPVPFRTALRILLAGSFVNLTTPTAKLGGGFLRAAMLHRRYDWGRAEAYGRAFSDQASNAMGSVGLYGALALVASVTSPDLPGAAALRVSGIAVLAVLVLSLLLRGWGWRQLQRPAWVRLAQRLTPARFRERDGGDRGDWIRPTLYPFLGESSVWRTLVPEVLLGAASFALLCLANAMVLRALGVQTDLWPVAASVVLGYFVGIASGVWGGIGVTEAALAGLYVQFGVPAALATAGALLHRATFYLVVLGWGGISLWRETRGEA